MVETSENSRRKPDKENHMVKQQDLSKVLAHVKELGWDAEIEHGAVMIKTDSGKLISFVDTTREADLVLAAYNSGYINAKLEDES